MGWQVRVCFSRVQQSTSSTASMGASSHLHEVLRQCSRCSTATQRRDGVDGAWRKVKKLYAALHGAIAHLRNKEAHTHALDAVILQRHEVLLAPAGHLWSQALQAHHVRDGGAGNVGVEKADPQTARCCKRHRQVHCSYSVRRRWRYEATIKMRSRRVRLEWSAC